jgi:hypothetical protein
LLRKTDLGTETARAEGGKGRDIPEGVEDDDDEAVYGWRGPGGAPGGDAGAVVPVAVEVELGACEEEAAREEVDGQRVDGEYGDEEQRPRTAPGGFAAAAAARRRRHRSTPASGSEFLRVALFLGSDRVMVWKG